MAEKEAEEKGKDSSEFNKVAYNVSNALENWEKAPSGMEVKSDSSTITLTFPEGKNNDFAEKLEDVFGKDKKYSEITVVVTERKTEKLEDIEAQLEKNAENKEKSQDGWGKQIEFAEGTKNTVSPEILEKLSAAAALQLDAITKELQESIGKEKENIKYVIEIDLSSMENTELHDTDVHLATDIKKAISESISEPEIASQQNKSSPLPFR